MTDYSKPARVRFAPSPTGFLHLGGARTALFDYLMAKKTNGQFILRIEDTDRKRFVEGAEQEIISSLKWLGIEWDEGPDVGGPCGPYRQSERKQIYQEYAEKLINEGKAYYCFCTPERLDQVRQEQQKNKETLHYDRTCRDLPLSEAKRRVAEGERHVIRFKMPDEGSITVTDVVRGAITVENRALDDYIIVKSDGLALYHLAAAVDDHLMGITHVIRGSEWLSTFPLHGHIHRAFGWQEPEWVHLSIFLKPSGKGKMSKREAADLNKDGYSIFVKDMGGLGYLPEAVVNWIALMGWSYDDHTEHFLMADLIEKFNLEKLNPAPAAINFTKLDHFNGVHIRSLSIQDLAQRTKPFFEAQGLHTDTEKLEKIAPIIQERLSTLDECVEKAGFFFVDEVTPEPGELAAKGLTTEESAKITQMVLDILKTFPSMK
ncbi:MAG: glutamate--tRNA ligase, partial [Anaerolineae bacterium]|nr:glutamate--tRNA ligase [Anaerolineae bacterium]